MNKQLVDELIKFGLITNIDIDADKYEDVDDLIAQGVITIPGVKDKIIEMFGDLIDEHALDDAIRDNEIIIEVSEDDSIVIDETPESAPVIDETPESAPVIDETPENDVVKVIVEDTNTHDADETVVEDTPKKTKKSKKN